MSEIVQWGEVCWASKKAEFGLKVLTEAEKLRLRSLKEKVSAPVKWWHESPKLDGQVTSIWVTPSGFQRKIYSSLSDFSAKKPTIYQEPIELTAELIEKHKIGLSDIRAVWNRIEAMTLLRRIFEMMQEDKLLREFILVYLQECYEIRLTSVGLVRTSLSRSSKSEKVVIGKDEPNKIDYELVAKWNIEVDRVRKVLESLET